MGARGHDVVIRSAKARSCAPIPPELEQAGKVVLDAAYEELEEAIKQASRAHGKR